MPRFLHPTQSGVHRLACLSLYHALLSQCSKPWLTRSKASHIRALIQARFHLDQRIESPSRIEKSLKAGYEALNLMKSCERGDVTSIERVDSLIAGTEPFLERYKQNCARLARERQAKELEDAKKKQNKRRFSAKRVLESVLARPYPTVSGIRRVPRFACARGIPFLRIKKPQPKNLSVAIQIRQDARWKNILRRQELGVDSLFAKDEDMWDQITSKTETDSWDKAIQQNINRVVETIKNGDERDLELARKMWNVVVAERRLAEKEARQREKMGQANGTKSGPSETTSRP
ncbi:hypothetical protein TMEN_4563 [Trichophyton mentagrophytes]|uniref:Complex 1 LYR protein domain-containing protein n=1 Tax=Trichophyton tonsurans (strain CBS 112818) TaxID=647933 RepID=F2S7Z3_TRIT1|nr:hypothetical protein TESG_07021 [Trichophyton tonsurans CBS 112818]EZF32768.1 hypothetical protein H101_03641 [Trichophyton interdigitale H6]GBF62039.1 hypothetical protein TMEN_4563 [Trichophyton mentagrophytes]